MSKVETFLVDHSILEMEMKINNILNQKSNVAFKMNTYQLSELMYKINQQYYKNVEENPVL